MQIPLVPLLLLALSSAPISQAPPSRTPEPGVAAVGAAEVRAAVDRLGSIDFPVRRDAARTVRRAAPAVAVPALLEAVASHSDWYVRFRALVVLSGFNHPRTGETMLRALGDPNDRLRALAYAWFERHPDPAVLPRLLTALDKEESEFVRPALTRALAAQGADPRARDATRALVMKGQDLFRAVAIEALGEHRGVHALAPIVEVARMEGPLQDDAVLAVGRIGEKKGLAVLADLQRTAPRTLQPSIAAAICLIGSNCPSHARYLTETLAFAIEHPGHQDLLRAAANALAALASAGDPEAVATLVARGTPTRDPERAAIALALGTVALRNPALLLQVLGREPETADGATELLREAFDMLDEDFEEERFYAAVRRAYWAAPAGSPARATAERLIQRLEF